MWYWVRVGHGNCKAPITLASLANDIYITFASFELQLSPVKSLADQNDVLCYVHHFIYQVGTKVAAVSRKTNTTTHEILGVLTKGNTQIVCHFTKFFLCCSLVKNETTSSSFDFSLYYFLWIFLYIIRVFYALGFGCVVSHDIWSSLFFICAVCLRMILIALRKPFISDSASLFSWLDLALFNSM